MLYLFVLRYTLIDIYLEYNLFILASVELHPLFIF
nr:MAG TPA: hypothetical protein [Caudoviricetes sp.]